MGMVDRGKVAKCWNQPDTLRKTAHKRWKWSTTHSQNQQCLESLWLLPPLCQPSFKALVAGGPLKRNIRIIRSGHSLTITQFVTKLVPGTMHVVLWQAVHTVTLVGGFSPNTWEPSQHHKPAWLRRTLGKDKSCLLFQNFSIQNHFLKAAKKIYQFFQDSTPFTASKEVSDHQMTPTMGFPPHPKPQKPFLCLCNPPLMKSMCCGSSTCRFCWWEYAPCRHMGFCFIHWESKKMSNPKQTPIHRSEIGKSNSRKCQHMLHSSEDQKNNLAVTLSLGRVFPHPTLPSNSIIDPPKHRAASKLT